MIVLGPHVLAHPLLAPEGEDEGHGNEINVDSDSDYSRADGDDGDGSPPASAPARGEATPIHEESIRPWREARLRVSAALGSIGAPPLSPSADVAERSARVECSRTNVAKPTDDARSKTLWENLESLSELATAHVELLQTAHRMIETLTIGTSVRLGLGPVTYDAGNAGGGNGRLMARAERAWVAQHHRESEGHCDQPRLTFQKSRDILHLAIVDQAGSLAGCLRRLQAHAMSNFGCQWEEYCSTPPWPTEAARWEEFALDLQHSLRHPTVLTLSQLSNWRNRLGGFLSFVLSAHLSRSNLPTKGFGAMLEGARRSSQMVRERIAFLHAACPPSRPRRGDNDGGIGWNNRGHCGEVENDPVPGHAQAMRERKRQGQKEIQNLNATLEAARVSLWAFEYYFSICNNDANVSTDDRDTPEIWWREFKDLVHRASASTSEFEDRFLSTADCEDEQEALLVNVASDIPQAKPCVPQPSEHVSNATPTKDENLLTNGDGINSRDLPINKTLVFSGSGARRPTLNRNVSISSEKGRPPLSFDAGDQSMLLRDLERRIQAMGLAEEHVVVDAETVAGADREDEAERAISNGESDAKCQERSEQATVKDAPSPSDAEDRQKEGGKSQPFFLGASGALLAELSSAIGPSHNGIADGERGPWDTED